MSYPINAPDQANLAEPSSILLDDHSYDGDALDQAKAYYAEEQSEQNERLKAKGLAVFGFTTPEQRNEMKHYGARIEITEKHEDGRIKKAYWTMPSHASAEAAGLVRAKSKLGAYYTTQEAIAGRYQRKKWSALMEHAGTWTQAERRCRTQLKAGYAVRMDEARMPRLYYWAQQQNLVSRVSEEIDTPEAGAKLRGRGIECPDQALAENIVGMINQGVTAPARKKPSGQSPAQLRAVAARLREVAGTDGSLPDVVEDPEAAAQFLDGYLAATAMLDEAADTKEAGL